MGYGVKHLVISWWGCSGAIVILGGAITPSSPTLVLPMHADCSSDIKQADILGWCACVFQLCPPLSYNSPVLSLQCNVVLKKNTMYQCIFSSLLLGTTPPSSFLVSSTEYYPHNVQVKSLSKWNDIFFC